MIAPADFSLPQSALFLLAKPWKARVVLDQGEPRAIFQRRYERGNAVIMAAADSWHYWFEIGAYQPIDGKDEDGAKAWSALREAVATYQAAAA